jgi:hypothetical protein
VGLEASGSAHYWARELMALGHEARIMPPAYVKPYIRRQKNDAADAAAICEAVTRPSMRFVGVRSLENQAALMRHKTREMLVSQRTQLLNGLRGHLTEIGVIAAQGPRHARELAELIEACDETVPFEVCEALAPLVVQLRNLDEAIVLARNGQRRLVCCRRCLRLFRQQCAEDLEFPGKLALHVRPYVFEERQILGFRFGEAHLEMRAAVLPFVERIAHQDFGSARDRQQAGLRVSALATRGMFALRSVYLVLAFLCRPVRQQIAWTRAKGGRQGRR